MLYDTIFFSGHVAAAGHHADGTHAHQSVEKIVARGFGPVAAGHALLQHQMAVQAFLDRPGKSQAAMVGLHGPAGDDGVRALGQRVGNGEIQLAGLVAAARAGQQVVPLDPDVGLVAQGPAEAGRNSSGVASCT